MARHARTSPVDLRDSPRRALARAAAATGRVADRVRWKDVEAVASDGITRTQPMVDQRRVDLLDALAAHPCCSTGLLW